MKQLIAFVALSTVVVFLSDSAEAGRRSRRNACCQVTTQRCCTVIANRCNASIVAGSPNATAGSSPDAEAARDGYTITVPTGKQLVLDIEFRGEKEQTLFVVSGSELSEYLRNFEGRRIENGHFFVSKSFGPWGVDRTVMIFGQSKNCIIGQPQCASHEYETGFKQVESESPNHFNVWWAEGLPMVTKHIDVKGTLQ